MAIELDNSFTVPVPPEKAWDVLLDVERIAPCMPGASVTSISEDGNEIEGQVKVKLGPLSLTYKGTAKFTDKDQENHTIAIEATGKETRGAGTASANVQATLKPGDATGSTLVSIHTSLNVTGRPAQFGRSLLPEAGPLAPKSIPEKVLSLRIARSAGASPKINAVSSETPRLNSRIRRSGFALSINNALSTGIRLNSPFVVHTAKVLGEIHGMDAAALADRTTHDDGGSPAVAFCAALTGS